MELKDVMNYKNFVVVGNTIKEDKRQNKKKS